MTTKMRTALKVTVLLATLLAGQSLEGHQEGRLPRHIAKMTPCVFEDGSGGPLPCYWDAKHRGNGQGSSFWVDRQGRTHTIKSR